MDLFIARHAESLENIGQNRSSDPDLSAVGVMQAQALGERMAEEELTAVFASPALRAIRTAAAVLHRQNNRQLKLEILPELAEYAFPPDFAMQSEDVLQTICPICTPVRPYVYSAETPTDVYARAQKALDIIRMRCNSEDACVFVASHGCFNNYLLQAAAGLPLQAHFNFSEQNACLSLIRYLSGNGHKHVKLRYINSVAHLPPDCVTGR